MNDLIGTHVGFIFDNDESTPHLAAMLKIAAEDIELQMPLLKGVTDGYRKWFPKWGEPDNDGVLPQSIIFRNLDQTINLTNLSRRHYASNFGGEHATGIVNVGCAVSIGNWSSGSYDTLNGLHSELAGLPAWVSPGVFSMTIEPADDGRPGAIKFRAERQPSIQVPGVEGLALKPGFETRHDDANGYHSMRETMRIETRYAVPAEWATHRRLHRALQDLISIAFWFPCNATAVTVMRDDDPERDVGGGSHGESWRELVVPNFGRRLAGTRIDNLPKDRRPLFYFKDIGPAGLAKWFAQYDELGQAMWVLASSLFRHGGTVEVRLLQIGTALEALGYAIALRTGRMIAGKRDGGFTFVEALKEIAKDTDCSLAKVLGDQATIEDWADSFNAAYKGVKHADNPLPAAEDAYNRAVEGEWLARLWLARNLGVDRKTLEEQRIR